MTRANKFAHATHATRERHLKRGSVVFFFSDFAVEGPDEAADFAVLALGVVAATATASQDVGACAAEDGFVVGAAVDEVISGHAEDAVAVATAQERVVAALAEDDVLGARADDGVVALAGEDEVGAVVAEDGVV